MGSNESLGKRLLDDEAKRRAAGVSPGSGTWAVRRVDVIRSEFERVKSAVAQAIEAGHPLRPIKLDPAFEHFDMNGVTITAPRHPNHDLFVEFEAWLKANDLSARIEYQHDGGGISSWHEIHIEPGLSDNDRAPSKWMVSGNTGYRLVMTGWRRGKKVEENHISFRVDRGTGTTDADAAALAERICGLLNAQDAPGA